MVYMFAPVSGQYIFPRVACSRRGCVTDNYDILKLFLKNFSIKTYAKFAEREAMQRKVL